MEHKSKVEDGYDAAYFKSEPNAEDDGYDAVYADQENIQRLDVVDSNPKKEINLQVVENPYYEKEWTETENDDKPSNQDEDNIDVNNAEIIKTTQNVYYEM